MAFICVQPDTSVWIYPETFQAGNHYVCIRRPIRRVLLVKGWFLLRMWIGLFSTLKKPLIRWSSQFYWDAYSMLVWMERTGDWFKIEGLKQVSRSTADYQIQSCWREVCVSPIALYHGYGWAGQFAAGKKSWDHLGWPFCWQSSACWYCE